MSGQDQTATMERAEILWHCGDPVSTEHGVLEERADGWRIGGVVILRFDDAPAHIDYSVTLDVDWRTTQASIEIDGRDPQSFEVSVSDERWQINGVHEPALDGCIDIDLGFTPATNTLPIRRLALPTGGSCVTRAAWFVFPEATFRAAQQTYTHNAAGTWLYESGTAHHELAVDERGRVVRYGHDLWRAIA